MIAAATIDEGRPAASGASRTEPWYGVPAECTATATSRHDIPDGPMPKGVIAIPRPPCTQQECMDRAAAVTEVAMTERRAIALRVAFVMAAR